MYKIKNKFLVLGLVLSIFLPVLVFAHQPRVVSETRIDVVDPEISKAYYATLSGEPHIYTINSDTAFDLYVNILVPDTENYKTDVSFSISQEGKTENQKVFLAQDFDWKRLWEEFGRSWYWQGAEYKETVEPGTYIITVWSDNNDSQYSLAVGEIEAFDFAEGINAIKIIPDLKKNFFDESPAGFIFSPFGFGYVFVMYFLAFIFGFVYRFFALRWSNRNPQAVMAPKKNIGWRDRFVRFLLGLVLLVFAIYTSWNPLLLFVSGFCIFQALFSWCALYQAIGKNTCPTE